jgi:hypothetical protein
MPTTNSKENDPDYVYNPESKRWILRSGTTAKRLGLSSVAKPKAKPKASVAKAKPKASVAKPKAKPKAQAATPGPSASLLSDFYAQKEKARKKYPSNQAKRMQYLADLIGIDASRLDEYEADLIQLDCPTVPFDALSISLEQEKKGLKDSITENCGECYKFIKGRNMIKSDDDCRWQYMSTVCHNCEEAIGKYYHKKYVDAPEFKTYHKGTGPDIDGLMAHGNKQNYYNGTMYTGAKHWKAVAARRLGSCLPSAPKGGPKGK